MRRQAAAGDHRHRQANPEELIALGITLVAAWRLPMLFTVAIGVASLAVLRLYWQ
ncbi:hypothetical protein [Pseudomonas sp. Y3 TE3536]